jgi:GDP-L-fucose synthase
MTNLFGIKDDFRDQTSHVIPALIKKISKAKKENRPLEVWGNSSVTRDFITTDFASEVVLKTLQKNDGLGRINVASGKSRSIGQIVRFLRQYFAFENDVIWLNNKPTGQPLRTLDISKFENLIGIENEDFYNELERVCAYYILNENRLDEMNKTAKYNEGFSRNS